LKVDEGDLPVVNIGSSADLKVGEWVLAIGAPFGFDSSVTAGIVSAKGRSLPSDSYVPFIQTDVAINPGNSGGPLFNLSGEVVGINSQIFSRSGGYMGVSFAIPVDMAMDVVNQLKDGGKVSRGWLGVLIQEVDRDLAQSFGLDSPRGALVSQVLQGSPAEAAGVEPGDVIIRFNGETIYRSSELPRWVGRVRPESDVDMVVIRDGEEKTLSVTIGLLPDNPEMALSSGAQKGENAAGAKLGLTVRKASASELSHLGLKAGVVITQVTEGPARKAGLQVGDILVTLQGSQINSAADLAEAAANLPEDGTVAALVNRDGTPRFLALKLP
jgi:serine protease Do